MRNRKRNRLQYYDYSNAGWYFITICSKKHNRCFGEIKNDNMVLNKLGIKVYEYWNSIKLHFPNVRFGRIYNYA